MSLLKRLRQISGMEWLERRIAPGVTEYERTSPHVTVLTNTQSCHLHYWTTDEALAKHSADWPSCLPAHIAMNRYRAALATLSEGSGE